MISAPVNKIVSFSNVDGPGNRFVIFFQGCPFNCLYCHNPETINDCINCGKCVFVCDVDALKYEDNKVVWDESKCIDCSKCILSCKNNSSPKVLLLTVSDILEKIIKVKPYIQGITVSGGECMKHADFLLELFKEVKKLGLTCFIDTNGYYDFEEYQELLELTDGVMLDVKAFDNDYHEWLVKTPNSMTIKNLEYLISRNKIYEVRTVLLNDNKKQNMNTIENVARIVQDKCYYKLIKYRPEGVRLYALKYMKEDILSDEEFKEYIEYAKENGAKKVI